MPGRLFTDEPADGVVRVRISHPEKRGALDHAILDGLAALIASTDARCVLLTGDGDHFSSGYDIGDIPPDVFAVEAEKLVAHPFTSALDALDASDVPTVCAINGPAIGGGLELALACDLRVAATGTQLGMPPAKLGLVYSHTGLRRFIDAIGAPRTRELFLRRPRGSTPRRRCLGARQRRRRPVALDDAALGWASEIAGNAPLSVRGNKRVIRELLRAEGALDPEVERELIALREACFRSEDMREGVRAFAEKRAPNWRGA